MYVCSNSDFTVAFDFDAEWDAYSAKTARFRYNGNYQDIVFSGSECPVPVIPNAGIIEVGVYAGDLHTTTAAVVMAKPSILSGSVVHDEPPEDVYNQLMAMLNDIIKRIEALEQNDGGTGGGEDTDSTSSVLGVAILGKMILGG